MSLRDRLDRSAGNHVCCLAQADDEPFFDAYIHRGLAKGQQVLCVTDEQGAVGRYVRARRHGHDGTVLAARPASALYLAGGTFDADAMLDRYAAAVEASLRAGYTGLRVLADTTWLLRHPNYYDAFLGYEERVNHLFTDERFAAVCSYDARLVPEDWTQALLERHPLRAQGSDPAALAAGLGHATVTEDERVALRGEFDISNAAALRPLIAEYTTGDGDVHVDAGELAFIDVAGVRELVRIAQGLGAGRRLVVRSAPASLRLVVDTAGWGRLAQLELADAGAAAA